MYMYIVCLKIIPELGFVIINFFTVRFL